MTDRATVLSRIVPRLGGKSGSITSGTATTAVLAGLVGGTGDNTRYVDWGLLMPKAATDASQYRVITGWADSTGTATFATRADTDYTNETYLLVPPFSPSLADLRDACNETLRESRRTIRTILPTELRKRTYSLRALDWLRSVSDLDAVELRSSPNLLDNENFTRWQNGPALAPDSWTVAGTNATIARATTYAARGPYQATHTRVGADTTLTQSVPFSLAREFADRSTPATVSLAVLCVATSASKVRVGISDGLTTTYSSYHTGAGGVETLTVSKTLAAGATALSAVLSVDTGNTGAEWIAAYLVDGTSVPDDLQDFGSDAYPARSLTQREYNSGSPGGVLELGSAPGPARQLVLVSRRPYVEVTLDTDTTDCPVELLEHGALFRIASIHRPGEDRTRLDRLLAVHGAAYTRLLRSGWDLPAPPPLQQFVVSGA